MEIIEQPNESYTEGNLTKLEKSLNQSNPKMQLILENSKMRAYSPKIQKNNLKVIMISNVIKC